MFSRTGTVIKVHVENFPMVGVIFVAIPNFMTTEYS